MTDNRQGMSFLFSAVEGKGVTASGPSLKRVFEAFPLLRERQLYEVWCHCCNNMIWSDIDVHGNPSAPWDEEYQNGDDDYPVEIHEWIEAHFT